MIRIQSLRPGAYSGKYTNPCFVFLLPSSFGADPCWTSVFFWVLHVSYMLITDCGDVAEYGAMIEPVAADHSGGPTNHWIIHLKLQVNQFLFAHWFLFPSLHCLRKTPVCKQSRNHPPCKEVIREIRKCRAPSVFVSIPWARLIVLLLISPLGPPSFFSSRRLSPPRVSITSRLEINARPVEAATKTVITQNAANSWVITAYFIHCACGSHSGTKKKGKIHPFFNKLNNYGRISKYDWCLCAHLSISSALPAYEQNKTCEKKMTDFPAEGIRWAIKALMIQKVEEG